MITFVTIGGKKHMIETNARGDIITKDGKPVHHKGTEIKGLQVKNKHDMNSFRSIR